MFSECIHEGKTSKGAGALNRYQELLISKLPANKKLRTIVQSLAGHNLFDQKPVQAVGSGNVVQ